MQALSVNVPRMLQVTYLFAFQFGAKISFDLKCTTISGSIKFVTGGGVDYQSMVSIRNCKDKGEVLFNIFCIHIFESLLNM